MSAAVDTLEFFERLVEVMNSRHDQLEHLGEAEMTVQAVMRRQAGDFVVNIRFDGLGCAGVSEVRLGDGADFQLVGSLTAWEEMFDNISSNGRATGMQTINSLALMGERITCEGRDPMGLDKFSRFNQTLQEYLDGAAAVEVGTR